MRSKSASEESAVVLMRAMLANGWKTRCVSIANATTTPSEISSPMTARPPNQ